MFCLHVRYLLHKHRYIVILQPNIIGKQDHTDFYRVPFSSSYILEYNERNYENNSRYGINVDIDGNPIEVPLSDDKVDGAEKMFNGDIVLVRKGNQQLFTRRSGDGR